MPGFEVIVACVIALPLVAMSLIAMARTGGRDNRVRVPVRRPQRR